METKTLYRYKKVCYEESLEYGGQNNVQLSLIEYPVIRETNSFYIVRQFGKYGKEKRVSKFAHNPFAAPDKSKAMQQFIRRAESSIRFNQHYIRFAKLAIEAAKKELEEML